MVMLNMFLWRQIAKDRLEDYMCSDCIREKLGREPTAADRSYPWWDYQLE